MKKLLLVLVTLSIFSLGVALFPVMLVLRPNATFKAMNRFCGAVYLGFDGKETISKTCGLMLREDPSCEPCKRICGFLAKLDPQHCEKEVD